MRRSLLLCSLLAYGCSSDTFDVAAQPDGSTDDTSQAADSNVTPNEDSSTSDTEADAPGPGCDPSEKPSADAVFVSTTGNDSTGDGSATTPFKSIYKAIASAKVKLAPKIVLDQGTYSEPVILSDTDFPLTIEGGWKRVGSAWSRACEPNVRETTLIQSPAQAGVAINNVKKRSGLARLTVTTRATAEAGQSLIGVLVRGQSLFFLDDVAVKANRGGNGMMAATAPPTAAPMCDGVTGCSTAGLTGGTGTTGAPAVKGTFVSDGYVPANGGNGGPGGNGSHGTPGGPANSSGTNECNWGCSGSSGCNASLLTTVVSKPGKCGCGGVGGKGGDGGRGGGASIAVQVFGPSATVDIKRSSLTASDGGNGSPGATGGIASMPTKGSVGDSATCNYGGCTGDVMACYYVNSKTIPGGTAGGDGRPAGNGGNGGGGSGGPSHALVSVGSTVTVDSATTLIHGSGGVGANGAASGTAGPKLTM